MRATTAIIFTLLELAIFLSVIVTGYRFATYGPHAADLGMMVVVVIAFIAVAKLEAIHRGDYDAKRTS